MERLLRSFRESPPLRAAPSSELVRRFAIRAGGKGGPREAVAEYVSHLRESVGTPLTSASIGQYLEVRNVKERQAVSALPCDGYIEPRGSDFADGFRIVLKKGVPETRMCFTVAHEICHTFFYESVPEIKFSPHEVDEQEEALCNYGAACLLMPAEEVISRAKNLPRGISSLVEIANTYGVSLDTAVLRLRSLKIWNCEFSAWRRMGAGEFAMNRFYGYQAEEWRWTDEEMLRTLWAADEGATKAGRTVVEYDLPNAYPAAKPVFYQARRRGEVIIALWSSRPFPQPSLPLLSVSRKLRLKKRSPARLKE
jgi:hypothetical protein